MLRRSPPVVVFNSEPSKRVVSLPCRASRVYRQNTRVACHWRVTHFPGLTLRPPPDCCPGLVLGQPPPVPGPFPWPAPGLPLFAVVAACSCITCAPNSSATRMNAGFCIKSTMRSTTCSSLVGTPPLPLMTTGTVGRLKRSEENTVSGRGKSGERKATTTKDRSPSVRCFPRLAFTPAVLGPDDKRVPSLPVWQNPTHTLQFGPSLLFFSRRPRVTRHCTKQSAARRFACP